MTPVTRQARVSSLWSLVERAAGLRPNAPALSDTSTTYTYAQLDHRSQLLAGALAGLGVGAGDAVLVCAGRTAAAVAALVALARVGAVPVPVDVADPPARVHRLAEIAGPRLVLADDAGSGAAAACAAPLLRLDEIAEIAETSDPAPRLRPDRPVPKGVEVTLANMTALLGTAGTWESSTEDDLWACLHAFTFDVSTWEIWRPLTIGAHVFVMPRAAQVDSDLAYSLLGERGVTVLCQTPTACRMLVDRVTRSGMPARLRRLYIGGEQLDFASLKPLTPMVAADRLEIWNLYGPAEATVYSTGHRLSASDIERERRSLIGRPLPHVQVEVRDVEPDGIGELWIGGGGVTAGYRRDPGLTKERFVTGESGERLYRTGDLVRDTGAGVLEFIGRTQGYVKVRGFRIEPGEIASLLCAHPAVAAAAATVSDAFPWGATLVGAVVARPGSAATEAELRRYLSAHLAQNARPGRIVFLDALPMLSSGKLDEVALRDRIHRCLGLTAAFGETEQKGGAATHY